MPESEARRLRVLLLDDDEGFALVVARRLAGIAEFQVATTVEEATEALESGAPVVAVISDIRVPPYGGVEAIRRLRKVTAPARIPIVAISGFDDEFLEETVIHAGADEFVSKDDATAANLTRALRRGMARTHRDLQIDRYAPLFREVVRFGEIVVGATERIEGKLDEGFDSVADKIDEGFEAASRRGSVWDRVTTLAARIPVKGWAGIGIAVVLALAGIARHVGLTDVEAALLSIVQSPPSGSP